MARILIVEDEILNAMNLEALFLSRGHTVGAIATSASQALAIAKTLRPDVVLMDIRLKDDVDGITTAERIAAVHPCGIIFLTGLPADGAMTLRMSAVSPEAVLAKPSSPEAIIDAVEKAIQRRTR